MPALFIILSGIVNFFYLRIQPPENNVEIEMVDKENLIINRRIVKKDNSFKLFKEHLGSMPRNLVLKTLIWSYIYSCIKFVNYTFFFWLPLYLDQSLNMGEMNSDLYSNVYDIGGIVGGFIGGYLMDRFSKKYRLCSLLVLLFSAIVFLGLFMINTDNLYIINALIFTIGLSISGPADMIASVIPVDLTSDNDNYKKYTSFVIGIIDGIASFLSGLGQILVGYVSQEYGWNSVFYILLINLLVSVICISCIIIKNCREIN